MLKGPFAALRFLRNESERSLKPLGSEPLSLVKSSFPFICDARIVGSEPNEELQTGVAPNANHNES